jgi:hypothetical protein
MMNVKAMTLITIPKKSPTGPRKKHGFSKVSCEE